MSKPKYDAGYGYFLIDPKRDGPKQPSDECRSKDMFHIDDWDPVSPETSYSAGLLYRRKIEIPDGWQILPETHTTRIGDRWWQPSGWNLIQNSFADRRASDLIGENVRVFIRAAIPEKFFAPPVPDFKRKKVVYVAGPFRGANHWEQEQNIRRAEEAALEVWRAGGAALCPHTNTRFYQGACPDEVWLEGDLELLSRCDAVYLIPGWSFSVGAREESDLAHKLGKVIFTNPEKLQRWLKEGAAS